MDKMNEKEIQKIDILSVLVLSILILQSILIILLLNSMRNLNVQVGLLMQSSASSQNSTSNLLIGKPYIDFALVDSNGNNFIFSNHLNKPTLLVFSNHQCSACQKMYPELRNFIVNNPQTDVVIIASNSQEQNMEFILAT